MSTRAKQFLERSMNNKYVVKGIVIGKETIDGKVYANLSYEKEKILVEENDLSNHEVRDKVGILMGAKVDVLIIEYSEELLAFIGSRNDAKEILKKLRDKRISVGDEIRANVIVVAKNNIIIDIYGTEVKIKSKYLKLGWVEDAREIIKLGEEIKVKILSTEPIEVEIVKEEENFDPEKYKIGDEYLARVIGIPDFGIICEISNERQVLCYKTEWREGIQIGQYVVVQINGIKPEEKRTYGYIKRRIRR